MNYVSGIRVDPGARSGETHRPAYSAVAVPHCRENAAVRQEAVEATLERNPNAFRPKIAPKPGAAEDADGAGRHNKVGNRTPLPSRDIHTQTRVS